MAKRPPALVACAAAAVAVAVSGCGGDNGVDKEQIRSVIHQFARSDGPEACSLLSDNAVVNVYGGFEKPVAQARAACVARSRQFKGEDVRITSMKVLDDSTVRVGALNPKGNVTYNLSMRRFGPAWRIDAINQSKTAQ